MSRIALTLVGVVVLLSSGSAVDVDAVTFAQAFRAGTAGRYEHQQVRGKGINFHGAISERLADGTTRTSLVMTLGAAANAPAPAVIKTWEEFVAAERARSTLVVALSGAGLPVPPSDANGAQAYEFSGVYDGQVRTIMRAPQASDSTTADSGPCKGEQPRPAAAGSFYCAPLLVSATARVVETSR